jgi:hypothetical protein
MAGVDTKNWIVLVTAAVTGLIVIGGYFVNQARPAASGAAKRSPRR